MTLSLVERVAEVEAKPETHWTETNVRLLLSQNVLLDRAMPKALEFLAKNPLCDAEFFSGDLMIAALNVDRKHWTHHQDHWLEAHSILAKLDDALGQTADARAAFMAMK